VKNLQVTFSSQVCLRAHARTEGIKCMNYTEFTAAIPTVLGTTQSSFAQLVSVNTVTYLFYSQAVKQH